MIKYRTHWCYDEIAPVVVDGETPGYVIAGGKRMAKLPRWGWCYFDTWDEAINHLLEKAGKEIEGVKLQLSYSNERREKVLQLRKPETTTDVEE